MIILSTFLLFYILRKTSARSRILLFVVSMLAIFLYTISSLSDITGLTFFIDEDIYFKVAKILTASIFLYWYFKRTQKNIFDHLRLLWVVFLLATFFIPEISIPKVIIYVVNIVLLYFILVTTIRNRIKSGFKQLVKQRS